jgi:hypothetical protein
MALTETFSKRYRTELVNSSREKSHIRPRKVYMVITDSLKRKLMELKPTNIRFKNITAAK